jgi:transcription initiation factor TFIID subunit 15
MGDMPSSSNMISAVFTSPQNMQDFEVGKDITFSVQIQNLNAGSFTNPDSTYYAAPQSLSGGKVTGHTHVTVQKFGDNIGAITNTQTPPDASTFAFFKGINDDGNGQGLLSATAAGGLSAGAYRVCSMTSASNHQPVLMPVAQRGAQDDCKYFTVGLGNGGNANGGNNGGNNNGGNNGGNANGANANGGNANGGNANAGNANGGNANGGNANGGNANGGNQNGGNNGGNQNGGNQTGANQGGNRRNRNKFAARAFIA